MNPAPVRMVDLAARHDRTAHTTERAVVQVLRSGAWIGGQIVSRAEALAAELCQRGGAVGVNSGTDGLMLALQAVGVRPGDEVIVPALTYFATAGAVCAIGARPVVVDVDERGLIDPAAIEGALAPSVRAVVPVHLFGAAVAPLDLPVPIVDDLAQAVGGAAGQGQLGAVSTYPTKTWGAAGDGGFVVGDDLELLERVRALGHHGTCGPHLHRAIDGVVGRNSRLDALQAAVLIAQATALPVRLTRRRANAAYYDAHLTELVRPLPREASHAVHQYVVRTPRRDEVVRALEIAGVECAVYYPRPLGAQPALRDLARVLPCPVAERLCDELLALPVHAGLEPPDLDRVVCAIADVLSP